MAIEKVKTKTGMIVALIVKLCDDCGCVIYPEERELEVTRSPSVE